MTRSRTPMSSYLGQRYETNNGWLTIINPVSSKEVYVVFDDGYETKTSIENIKKGKVTNRIFPKLYGVGYLGADIKYLTTDETKKSTQAYSEWATMLTRCYSEKYHNRKPSYATCIVAEEWHNFQNFAEWFYNKSNYRCGWQLDKDLLCYNNKVYSSENCVFIPGHINNLMRKHKHEQIITHDRQKRFDEAYDYLLNNGFDSDIAKNIYNYIK